MLAKLTPKSLQFLGKMARLLLLNGPNLNLLGSREPELYGKESLKSITLKLQRQSERLGHTLEAFQSDAEHELIGRIHQARRNHVKYMIFNWRKIR